MHEKFALYPLLNAQHGASWQDKNLLIQTLQSIHLIRWVVNAHKQTAKDKDISGSGAAIIRFLMQYVGNAQQALSRAFTTQSIDFTTISFSKKSGQKGGVCWWTNNRNTFAHSTTLSSICEALSLGELNEITGLIGKLESAIHKHLPASYQKNHFKDFPYLPINLSPIDNDGTSNFANLQNIITVARTLLNDHDYPNSLSHHISFMLCVELSSKNLILLESKNQTPDLNIDLVVGIRNDIIAHSRGVGDILGQMDRVYAALNWLINNKSYFNVEPLILPTQPEENEQEEQVNSSLKSNSSNSSATNAKETKSANIKPLYSRRTSRSKNDQLDTIPQGAIALVKSLVPWQKIQGKETDILSFTEHHVMSALLMEVERLYQLSLEERNYSQFDQIVEAFKPVVNHAHAFQTYVTEGPWNTLVSICGQQRQLTVFPNIVKYDQSRSFMRFDHLLYCMGDFALIQRVAALGFVPDAELYNFTKVIGFIRHQDTPDSAEKKMKQFVSTYKYYWGSINTFNLAESIIIALHPNITLKYLGNEFRKAVATYHTIETKTGPGDTLILPFSLAQSSDILSYPMCMLQFIPALFQHGMQEALRQFILGPTDSDKQEIFKAMLAKVISVFKHVIQQSAITAVSLLNNQNSSSTKTIEHRDISDLLVQNLKDEEKISLNKKIGTICDNYMFFAAISQVLQEQNKYTCTMAFLSNPTVYMTTMFAQASSGDYISAIQFLRETILPTQQLRDLFLQETEKVYDFISTVVDMFATPAAWQLKLSDVVVKYKICTLAQMQDLIHNTKKYILISECEQAQARGETQYLIYLLVLNNNKFQLAERLKGITDLTAFPTELPIREENSDLVASTNIFAIAKEFADREICQMLQDAYELHKAVEPKQGHSASQ